jgi:hypothetical protein
MSETEKTSDALGSARAWLEGIEVGEALHHRNLTLFPLYREGGEAETGRSPESDSEKSERYVLLSDAIEAGEAVVEEVSEGGSVPLLAVTNGSVKPILIPEGEILIGAKQNRTVNLTVLVAAGKRFDLPVSCVEQGRWGYTSRRFAAESYAHPMLRREKIRSAQVHRQAAGVAFSDQSAVWQSVEEHLGALDAASPTRDMVAGYGAAEDRMKEYRAKIELPEGACGFLAASGGKVTGVDLFDAPDTMRKLWKRVADAYFIEAVRGDDEAPVASRELAEAFLASVAESLTPAAKQPELGFELEMARDDIAGAALWHEGAVCHLSAFGVEEATV